MTIALGAESPTSRVSHLLLPASGWSRLAWRGDRASAAFVRARAPNRFVRWSSPELNLPEHNERPVFKELDARVSFFTIRAAG
jgi:hypothetical protein